MCGTSGRVSLQCTARRCVRRPIACFTRLYPTLELMFDENSNTEVDVTVLHASRQTNSKLTANCALFIDSIRICSEILLTCNFRSIREMIFGSCLVSLLFIMILALYEFVLYWSKNSK